MISLRQLLIIAVVIAGVWLLKRLQQRMLAGRNQPLRRGRARSDNDYKETVRCGQCGTYLLPADALNDKRDGHRCIDAKSCAKRAQANVDVD